MNIRLFTNVELVGIIIGITMILILITALFLVINFSHQNAAYWKAQAIILKGERDLYYETSQEQAEAMQMQCVKPKAVAHHQLSNPLNRQLK